MFLKCQHGYLMNRNNVEGIENFHDATGGVSHVRALQRNLSELQQLIPVDLFRSQNSEKAKQVLERITDNLHTAGLLVVVSY